MYITREDANIIIDKTINYAREKERNIVVAVYSKEGNPISVQVGQGAFLVSYELANKKAYTSAAFQMPSNELKDESVSMIVDILSGEDMAALGGGYPITYEGKMVGAIGVSGASEEEDMEFAKFAIKEYKKLLDERK